MTKQQLFRDGQIVGYSRSNGTVSYDNQEWFIGEIPHDDAKDFVRFDQTNLVEVYAV